MDEIAARLLQKKILELKLVVRTNQREYHRRLATYDCGAKLAEYISPDLPEYRKRAEEALEELKKLDPKFPCGAS